MPTIPSIHKDVDIVFLRELTEGMLYSETVVAGSPEFRPNDDITVAMRVITRKGSQPRRARGVRDRPHAQAQEGHRRPQGAGLSARLRHVRGGMPQGRTRVSGRDVRGDDDRLDLDEARHGAAAVRRGGDDQSVRRHPHRHRRRPGRRARARARPVRRREAGDGAGDPRLGARHLRPQHRQSLCDDHVGPDAARLARPQAQRADRRARRRNASRRPSAR